ncbi:DUF2130 domain-containing protein [Spiroplasma diminutum]|uniref:DUF2130 domain-containing protein n=1 Tax=Spiroplasma diminutum CUAS-1 TaxID=1276221 RepID=S5LWU6_9MOLU|nr:DUF2130 domain-containing protein [Spiroplasma diminutum]AGR42249.1 hypothetical protein SDIMI_v3c05450 [Spiroplasma diminutum CUAS-1]
MQKLLINCPECKKDIDLLSLGNRDSESVIEYKKHIEEDLRKNIEVEITNRLKETYSLELESQRKDLNLEKQNEISILKSTIENLTRDLQEVKSNNLRDIKELEIQLESRFVQEKQKELLEKNNRIQELELQAKSIDKLNEQKIKSIQLELNSNFEKEKSQLERKLTKFELDLKNIENEKQLMLNKRELELKAKYESVISTKEIEITDLKIANATNRILNNKTKGENWENEVELELRKLAASTGDEVHKITRTGTKADFLQVVREKELDLGKIVFECKNGEWKDTWEPKLTEDMAKEGANYAILVATSTSEKFKVPFLVSQKNKNILIADPDNFVFVCAMVRRLIIIESNLREKTDNNEVFERFNSWKLKSFETFKGIIQKSLDGIESDERTIINKVEDIKKNRERLWRNWQTLMLDFIEDFKI